MKPLVYLALQVFRSYFFVDVLLAAWVEALDHGVLS
jgi:hypothetical protein